MAEPTDCVDVTTATGPAGPSGVASAIGAGGPTGATGNTNVADVQDSAITAESKKYSHPPNSDGPIVATMLTGNGESIVADAVRSVIDWVDLFLLIDTGITDQTAEIAKNLAGPKFLRESFPWCHDFARARNFALERAGAHGGSWALTIDTDERLSFPGVKSPVDLRTKLNADARVLIWLVPFQGDYYTKERFVRVPTKLRWQGQVHEALTGAASGQIKILPGVTFLELAKTSAQIASKLTRDLTVLREETRKYPDDPRWWYYLGQTLEDKGDLAEAVDAYRRCATLDGWAEQAAWACYKAGGCLAQLGELSQAIEQCAYGLSKLPGSPELAWLAGFCCYQLRLYSHAIHWEQMAIALGQFKGAHSGQERTSFRHLPAWYEAPFDVLRFAYRALGRQDEADGAERDYQLARRKREGEGKG